MPTTRRSSAVPSTPPPPTFELPRSPKTRSSSAKPRSSYQAPGVRSHHHRSADELALEEAAKLLHATPTSLAHDGMGIEDLDGSTRSSRHKRLTEARHLQGEEERETAVEAPELADEVNGAQDEAFPSAKDSEEGDAEHGPESNDNDRGRLEEAVIQADQESVPGSEKEVQAPAGLDTPIVSAILPTSENEDSTGGSDSSTDSSDSDIDSEETSDTGTEEEEENSDEEDERLEKLLQAARVSAVAKDFGVGNGGGAGENGEEVMLQFDKPDDPPRKEAPIPDMNVPTLPRPHLSFDKTGRAQAHAQLAEAGPSRRRSTDQAPEPDDRPYQRELSKKEKAAQPRKATPSELWAALPTPKSELLPKMKRDYQALSLANSLDPKRFMKGGNKSGKLPKVFAIGTLVEPPRHLQDSTVSREARYRPGQVVQGLVRDEGAGTYAKRKYGDLQFGRMENGRGKGWKKRSKW